MLTPVHTAAIIVLVCLAVYLLAYPFLSNTISVRALTKPRQFLRDPLSQDKILTFVNDLGLVFALVYGLYLRLRLYFSNRSLYLDTASLANDVLNSPYLDLLKPLPSGQSAPAGFLVVTKWIGSLFNYNEYSLLFLPLMFGMASLVLFTVLSLYILGRKAAYIAVIIFSLSSSAIYYSAEYKQYSGDVFFTTLLLLLAVIVIKKHFSTPALISLSLAGLFAIWFSHTSLFIVPAVSLGLLYSIYLEKKHYPALKKVASLLFIWLLYYGVIFLLVINPSVQPSMYNYFAAGFAPWPIHSLQDIQWYVDVITQVIRYPLGFSRVFEISMVCMLAGLILFLNKANRYIGVMLLVPLLFLFIASILRTYPIIPAYSEVDSRLVLFVLPILGLAIAEGAWYFTHNQGLFIAGIFIVFLLSSQLFFPTYPSQQEETRPLIEYMDSHKLPSDKIYVYRFTVPAFQYYTRAQPVNYVPLAYNPPDYTTQLTRLSPPDRLWLIFSHIDDVAKQPILDYLDTQAQKIDEQNTEGASLYLYSY